MGELYKKVSPQRAWWGNLQKPEPFFVPGCKRVLLSAKLSILIWKSMGTLSLLGSTSSGHSRGCSFCFVFQPWRLLLGTTKIISVKIRKTQLHFASYGFYHYFAVISLSFSAKSRSSTTEIWSPCPWTLSSPLELDLYVVCPLLNRYPVKVFVSESEKECQLYDKKHLTAVLNFKILNNCRCLSLLLWLGPASGHNKDV